MTDHTWAGYLECNVPFVASGDDGYSWAVSWEMPPELQRAQAEARDTALETIGGVLERLRDLPADESSESGEAHSGMVVFSCALTMRRNSGNRWRAAVKVIWPEIWAELSSVDRFDILAAAVDSLKTQPEPA